jgi:hypothetical protein
MKMNTAHKTSKFGVPTDLVFCPFNLPIDFGVIYKKLPPHPLEYRLRSSDFTQFNHLFLDGQIMFDTTVTNAH